MSDDPNYTVASALYHVRMMDDEQLDDFYEKLFSSATFVTTEKITDAFKTGQSAKRAAVLKSIEESEAVPPQTPGPRDGPTFIQS